MSGVLGRLLWVPVFLVMAVLAVFFFAVFASLLVVWIAFVLFRLWQTRRAYLRAQVAPARTDGPIEAEYRVIEEPGRLTKRR